MATATTTTAAARARGPERDFEPLDTAVRLVTPERIRFQYPLAGPFRRAVAYLIDLVVWLVFWLVVGLILLVLALLQLGGSKVIGILLVVYFLSQWGYGAFCEALFNGRTPGKRAMGIRVVTVEGVPIRGAQAVLRNLLWVVEWFLPFGYLPAIASMVLTRRFQRLGDLAAGTMVVVERRAMAGGVAAVREPGVERVLTWLPTQVAAGPELARALSDYVKRRRRFGPDLREEIAAHVAGPIRSRYALPVEATNDAIVCALYHRVFLGD
ncbi:MAG TPA: RDD family protein [Isosphaeraceae bacterium]|jgi:uncharacterized RDD family membrane protein YckC|nr:RDD family protein [Isosphaeraceae bacterium]